MLGSFLTRIRLAHRQRRQARQLLALSAADAQALAAQAAPQPGRVLVVRNDSIGDYLLYRPWLRRLSRALHARGQQRPTLLANKLWAPLAQAWDAEWCEEIVAVDFKAFTTDLPYRAGIVRRLGQKGFTEVIYPLHVREAAVENFIRFLQAPVRIASEGAHPPGPWFALLNASYSLVLPSTRAVLFEYDRNREFFENWQRLSPAASEPPGQEPAPLVLPPAVHEAAQALAATLGPYVVLFPGASARQKRWPPQYFAQLAQRLHQHYGARYKLVIAGSAADAQLAQQLARAAGPAVPLHNRCGQTDLPGLAALLAGAQLVISNDTVAAHAAVQAGVPSLVMLMGENYGKFFPYPPALLRAPCRCLFPPSQEARFAQGDFSPPPQDPDISKIEVVRVLAAAQELLG